ncbi:Lrp/AsnC family transcriptional regulator [Govanella unica]|uniref:Lrp/AsnC family transcriptional regulator n=1 Tax=Govanella unica TaxID=2975056 RepID=A0A9X3TY75_9PROT|nr:Lrp/AsnC family transcriptional regulator [Govania unica]MDA5194135.1 Lrp/AsnC family transcriptional regulator [Govania unica]
MTPLDAADRKIIRVLQTDGRISNSSLAAEVGLSPSACLRRLRLLEQSGVIRGYTAIIDEQIREDMAVVIVQITLERQTEAYFRKFENAIRKYPEIRECYLMTGGSDYLLRVEAASTTDYERIHTELLSNLPGVARIHSSFALRNVTRSLRSRD